MMVCTVWSDSCLLFFYSRCPSCPAICKSWGICPHAPWSRRHWWLRSMQLRYSTHIAQSSYKNAFNLPVQVTPSPMYPVLHVHVKLPSLLAQVAKVLWHPPLFVVHSSISVPKLGILACLPNWQLHGRKITTELANILCSVNLSTFYSIAKWPKLTASTCQRILCSSFLSIISSIKFSSVACRICCH